MWLPAVNEVAFQIGGCGTFSLGECLELSVRSTICFLSGVTRYGILASKETSGVRVLPQHHLFLCSSPGETPAPPSTSCYRNLNLPKPHTPRSRPVKKLDAAMQLWTAQVMCLIFGMLFGGLAFAAVHHFIIRQNRLRGLHFLH
ncbi:hypothetical protein N656DRAFT_711 [Canariomyces notabilis]|uniref:Uncharacterized protein n=1 Tax=Canariomyces notabilis TaxID=2074819 RepID=A0AAN6YWR6_9PEZI|nr:hypothetical protein N656DRAFT_711 [Canariomyces arenarius]